MNSDIYAELLLWLAAVKMLLALKQLQVPIGPFSKYPHYHFGESLLIIPFQKRKDLLLRSQPTFSYFLSYFVIGAVYYVIQNIVTIFAVH